MDARNIDIAKDIAKNVATNITENAENNLQYDNIDISTFSLHKIMISPQFH